MQSFIETQSEAAEQTIQALFALVAGIALFRLIFSVRTILSSNWTRSELVTLIGCTGVLLAVVKTIVLDFASPNVGGCKSHLDRPSPPPITPDNDEASVLELSIRLAMLSVVALVANICAVTIFAGLWTLCCDIRQYIWPKPAPSTSSQSATELSLSANPFVALNEKAMIDAGLEPASICPEQTVFSWETVFDVEQWSRMYIYTGFVCGLVTLYLTFHNSILRMEAEPQQYSTIPNSIVQATLTRVAGEGVIPTN